MPLIGDRLKLLGALISGRGECTACKDFTALGSNGDAGYFKMRQGAMPIAHAEAGFTMLWCDTDGRLHLLQGDGTDARVVMEEDGD